MIVIVKAHYAMRCVACAGEGTVATSVGDDVICGRCLGVPRMRPEIKVVLRVCRLGVQRTTFGEYRVVHAIGLSQFPMCGTRIEAHRLKTWWGVYSEVTCRRCLRHEYLTWDASAQARFV